MNLTFADLKPLFEHRGPGHVVSCYADLTGVPAHTARWPGPLQPKLLAIKEMFRDDPAALEIIERDLAHVGRALAAPEARFARGMAIFSARQRGLLASFILDEPPEQDLVIDSTPYLVPLLQSICRQRDFLVVMTDTHRGQLYAATFNDVRLLDSLEEEVPNRQRSSGERWGMQQATLARHRTDRIRHCRKDLASRIDKIWANGGFAGLVLLGEHEVLEHLRKELPARIGEKLVHAGAFAWTDKRLAIAEAIRAPLKAFAEAEERRILNTVEERRRLQHAIAAGPREVLQALQSGALAPGGCGVLVVGPDERKAVGRCTACGTLFAEVPTACSRCQAPCAVANLWEEVLLMGLRHGIAVHSVRAREPLAACGGMAALLSKRTAATSATAEPPGGV